MVSSNEESRPRLIQGRRTRKGTKGAGLRTMSTLDLVWELGGG